MKRMMAGQTPSVPGCTPFNGTLREAKSFILNQKRKKKKSLPGPSWALMVKNKSKSCGPWPQGDTADHGPDFMFNARAPAD